jgi:asparagine synthase (glutamine-hydrolysing)
VYLLHSRLAIIDLDPRADQPYRLGTRVLSYNGELYNFPELRPRLAGLGARFVTESDTEVLGQALALLGTGGLDDLEGMWAFALYDEADGSLLLCRDRFGEKPLYLYEDATGLYFGSEVKFIVSLLGRRLPVNLDHLRRYLVNGYKALYKTTDTFFCDLRELPRASFLSIDHLGEAHEERYWEPSLDQDEDMAYSEAVQAARGALLEAVRIRLRADVPLAFCMSGGVDSNSLISVAKRAFGYDVHGFTIVNTDERYEEQDLVAHAVSELRIRHASVQLDHTRFLERLRTLVRQHDAPVYTTTYYAHWLLMESIAQEGYRTSISGTGADELFSGYFDHHLAYLAHVHADELAHARAVARWEEHILPTVRNPHLRQAGLFVADPGFRDHVYLNASGFASYLHQPWSEPFGEVMLTPCLLRNRMLNEMFHEAVPVILHEDDCNAMYFSIENRSPYLDRRLFELCQRIPSRHLVQDGYAKAVLRDAMRGIVPERILSNHRKVGFNAPIFSLLDAGDPAVRSCLLEDSPVFDMVRRDRIEQLLAKPVLPNSESKFLFSFVNTKVFLEELSS